MTNFFPKATQWMSESMVSLNRIQTFLLMKDMAERRDYNQCQEILNNLPLAETPHMIYMKDAFFEWNEISSSNLHSESKSSESKSTKSNKIKIDEMLQIQENEKYVLKSLNISVRKGQLLGVCGPVGAGKSSLLNAILGELHPSMGTVAVRNKIIGYTSQSPWILSGSIKENILFGKTFNKEWFWKVIKACAMERDIERMELKEETVIGDRGVTLSGGQKARLALARAVYLNADIYLLDDPLSAVDTKVGKHLFEECICGILKEKVFTIF